MSGYIAVCGGVNIDIGGRSHGHLVPGDSNPGRIHTSLGGVGRNIAHSLALLGADVKLLTALGGDEGAMRIRESCRALGIDLAFSLAVPDAATSAYLYIDGPDGDMALAVSDMAIYERLTPDWFAGLLPVLNGAELVVLDANLPAESLAFLAERCAAPLLADPVSAAKAPRLGPCLGRLHSLKPNRLEAEVLSGVPIRDSSGAQAAADALLAAGLRRVYITLGPEGVLAAEGAERVFLANPPRRPGDASGCGDAFTAALAWATQRGADLRTCARAGLAAAAITMEHDGSVNPGLSAAELRTRMELI